MRRQPSARGGSTGRARSLLRKQAKPNQKPFASEKSLGPEASRRLENQGIELFQQEGLAMLIHAPSTLHPASEMDRLGDEIAELSAHLDAATARLLELNRAFDARGGWNTGFRSCAAWLSWRVGLDLGAARERVRVACPRDAASLGRSPGPRGALLCQGPRPDPRGHAGDRSAPAGGGARRDGCPRRADRTPLA